MTKQEYIYLYKTINIINGKIYIGVRKTNNLRDGYIGCGILNEKDAIRKYKVQKAKTPFISAVVKYGYDNFIKEVIEYFDDIEDAYKREEEVVNSEFIERDDTYNVKIGGKSGAALSIIKEYSLLDIEGNIHKGKNIKDFCTKNNLDYCNICRLVRGDINKSQGYVRAHDSIFYEKYVVVNIETKEIYFVKNITPWCRENFPELYNKTTRSSRLFNVISKRANLVDKKWWACREEDWEGEIKLNKPSRFVEYPVYILDPKGNEIEVYDVQAFAKEYELDSSEIYYMLKGKRKSHKKFKVKPNE